MTDLTAEAIKAISELTNVGNGPFLHPKGGLAVKLPSGAIQHLEPLDAVLTHVKQSVKMIDASSLIAYVNRFKGDGDKTTIFADYTGPKIKACIDYHEKGRPDYLHHDVTFVPPWSEQWARWRNIDGKAMSQIDFAEFIEENMADVVEPVGAVFLDLVTGLQAKKKVSFESGIRLHDGTNQLTYNEEVEAKGRNTMTIPAEFAIGVPVFFQGEAYKIRCLLRYRIDDGRLLFTIKINRRLFAEQSAFADITKAIGEATGLVVLNGSV